MSSEKNPNETPAAPSEQAAAPGEPLSPEQHVEKIGKVESKVPGRMRVRLRKDLRSQDAVARIQQSLDNHPDIRDAQVNPTTGSVTFTHAPGKDGHKILAEVLREGELLADVAFDIPSTVEGEGGGEDPYSKLDQQLADLVYKVEGVVYKKTGLRFRGQTRGGHCGRARLLPDVCLRHHAGDAPRTSVGLAGLGHLPSRQQGTAPARRTCAGQGRGSRSRGRGRIYSP